MLTGSTILITGGTGSFGKKFISNILKNFNPKKVIIFSRDELKQSEMQNSDLYAKYKKKLRFFIGDIRDYDRLNTSFENVDIVVHAAALKQVEAAEYNPFEFIKTNILGAENVIRAAHANNVKKIIALSTDKASSPINLYGATKLCSDKLFVAANNLGGKKISKFSVVRYGNVLGSRGSVVPFFLKYPTQKQLPITNLNMTRFSITLDQSVNFVIKRLENMQGGELYIPKIPSYRIKDIAKAIRPHSKIKVIGIRPGEKIHEEMISSEEAFYAYELKDFYVVLPKVLYVKKNYIPHMKKKYGLVKKCEENFSYNSKNNKTFLSVNEIKELLHSNKKDIMVN
tara:strand:- start:265 stop:1287 length:1023 start_codon:yes stop_codon:yes gene_type:complete